MYPNKKKEEYIASRLAREALEDVNCPKQIAYEDIRPHFTKRGPYRTKEDLEEVILGVAVFSEYVNYSATKLPEHLNSGGIPPFFRVRP